jgi:lysophospholipase L1-like esterase
MMHATARARVTTRGGIWVLALMSFALAPMEAQTPPPANGTRHLLVSIGDSYASGQGAPDGKINWWLLRCKPHWDDKRCNRSLNAGAKRAFDILTAPASSGGAGLDLEYVSFACSGATIERGLLGKYRGTQPPLDPTDELEPQVDQVASLAQDPHNTVDALTITIGGNDILFEYIVMACVVGTCKIMDPLIELRIADLAGRLEHLGDALAGINVAPDRIFILEYPDPTHEATGTYCDHKPSGDALAGISKCEARWASECILPKLNYQLCKIAQDRGWHYVGGIADAFKDHGWCAPTNWINTVNESLAAQGHPRGAMHPNELGYRAIGEVLAASIKQQLLGGSLQPPTCVPPPASPACSIRCD